MKKSRKGLLWLLIAITVLFSRSINTLAQYDISDNKFIDVKKTPSGTTGQNMTIQMIFTNDTDHDLNGVAVMFDKTVANEDYEDDDDDDDSSYTGDTFPFEITSSIFDAKILGKIKKGGSKSFTLSARVRRDISEGYYVVPLEVKTGGNHESYDKVNIWVKKDSGTTETNSEEGTLQFEVGENQNTPYGVYPNVMNFQVNVRNTSSISAFDVNIRMGLDSDSSKFPFDINDGNYTRHYDRIGGGETVEVPYSMAIREDAYSGYYPLTYTIEYKDSTDGEIQNSKETFYVNIKNKEKEEDTNDFNANDRTKARIIVDGFETNPKTVYAGDEFELTLHMKNASSNVDASNILFSLESEKVSESAVFTMDAGSSSIVVNSLPAGQTKDIKVKLQAGASVEQRTYALTVNQKYDSPEFKNAEEKVMVNIPVKQTARINTGTIDVMPDTISVGSTSNVMFPINNTGKVLLYNVMVSFVGDSIQQTDTYVGNIKPGETGNLDAMITGVAPTTDDGKIKILITYEDENGEVSEPIEKEISLMVTEQEEDYSIGDFENVPVDAELDGSSKHRNIIIISFIAILVVGTIGVVAVLKRRKKKKAAEEEIEDEI